MSFEYSADLTTASGVAEALRRSLAERYASVEDGDPHHLVLRRRGEPPRAMWPADLEVSLDPDRVVVVFHSGSRTERSEVLRLLEATLAGMGHPARFVEE
jgi:hypothetical protein